MIGAVRHTPFWSDIAEQHVFPSSTLDRHAAYPLVGAVAADR